VSFPNEVKQKWDERIPLGKLGQVDDLVGALVFLASEASNYVTGLDLIVDGGSTLGTFEPEALPHFKDKPKWLSFTQPSPRTGMT
jgi:enoyl-[acyl-carrier-protein] reductase (NADH)